MSIAQKLRVEHYSGYPEKMVVIGMDDNGDIVTTGALTKIYLEDRALLFIDDKGEAYRLYHETDPLLLEVHEICFGQYKTMHIQEWDALEIFLEANHRHTEELEKEQEIELTTDASVGKNNDDQLTEVLIQIVRAEEYRRTLEAITPSNWTINKAGLTDEEYLIKAFEQYMRIGYHNENKYKKPNDLVTVYDINTTAGIFKEALLQSWSEVNADILERISYSEQNFWKKEITKDGIRIYMTHDACKIYRKETFTFGNIQCFIGSDDKGEYLMMLPTENEFHT